MNIGKNIPKYYLFNFLSELMFIIPVIVVFWQQNGLSLTQIMVLQAIYAVALMLFEVPTGVVADKIGRKQSLVLGALTFFIGTIVYGLGYNFWQFVLAEIIWALGMTFVSGADAAFVYDSLKQEKQEKKYKQVWGNVKSFGYLGSMVAAIVGGLVAAHSLRLNWFLEAAMMFCMLLVALTFIEPKVYKKTHEMNYIQHVTESFKKVFKSKPLIAIFLFYALFSTVGRISLWFYQPYFQQIGIPIIYFGIVWASLNAFAIIGSKSAHRLEKFVGQKASLWIIILGTTLALIGMSFWFVIAGIGFILLQQFVRGFAPPVLLDYTNKLIPSKQRATLLSIQSLGGSLGFVIFGPIFGKIADITSLKSSLLITGVFFIILFAVLILWNKNLQSRK